MKTIKIISNPYMKSIQYYMEDEQEKGKWSNLKDTNPESKLTKEEYENKFLPFKIKDILDIIIHDYESGEEENKIKVIFEGTMDEYEEVSSLCKKEPFCSKIVLEKSGTYYKNAREILGDTKVEFKGVSSILEDIVTDPDAKLNFRKVTDALDDVIPVCVMGNYSAGKSTFINSLIGNELLPSGEEPVTAKIFEITKSEYDDVIRIKFKMKDSPYLLTISNNEYTVLTGDKNSELIETIDSYLEDVSNKNIYSIASTIIDVLNEYDCENDDEITESTQENENVDDVTKYDVIDIEKYIVEIEVPFCRNGILGQSPKKYIIIDTPGSNSASNLEHSKILSIAMENLSNGIPIWVTTKDSKDSIDNEKLCNMITEIEALDERFTMIVLNKADGAQLPELTGENNWPRKDYDKFMKCKAVKKMYAGGMYFVSSVMGLGSKGGLSSSHSKQIYESQIKRFIDKDYEFYLPLYKYNIMPCQIKEKVDEYSEKEDNLVYANSGLYCVEKEIENFAGRHSYYNKCQMVYNFLDSVIRTVVTHIDNKKEVLEKYKIQEQAKLNGKLTELQTKMTEETTRLESQYYTSSKESYKEFIKENINSAQSGETLGKISEEYTASNQIDYDYSTIEQKYEAASEKKWTNLKENFTGLFKRKVDFKTIVDNYVADNNELKENKSTLDETKKEIDKNTSDKLMELVYKEYVSNMESAQIVINNNIKQYWVDKAEDFKQQLLEIIAETDNLETKEKSLISEFIINYEPFSFDEQADQIFVKEKFLRRNSEVINTQKLAGHYNAKLKKNVLEFADARNEKGSETFSYWENSLKNAINNNIARLNPEVKDLTAEISMLEDDIVKLDKNKSKINTAIETIKLMMEPVKPDVILDTED